jgi:hypothetical protein
MDYCVEVRSEMNALLYAALAGSIVAWLVGFWAWLR